MKKGPRLAGRLSNQCLMQSNIIVLGGINLLFKGLWLVGALGSWLVGAFGDWG